MSKRQAPVSPGKDLARLLSDLAHRHPITQIFRDWVEMCALSIANAVDRSQYVAREKRYLSVINKYEKPDRMKFAPLLGHFIMELDRTREDVFGPLLAHLEMNGNKGLGQFITPWNISYFMAQATFGTKDAIEKLMEGKGYITMMEPACGAGGMVLASARACEDAGINPQQCLHVTAVDIDPLCTHMTYIQCALSGLPAVVCLGDSLGPLDQMREYWFTPFHIIDGWSQRLEGKKPQVTPRLVGDATILEAVEKMQELLTKAG